MGAWRIVSATTRTTIDSSGTPGLDIRVWVVLEDHHVEVPKLPLGVAGTVDEANDAHAALAAGYWDWSCTCRAGWPLRFCGPGTFPPWPRNMQWAQEQFPKGIT